MSERIQLPIAMWRLQYSLLGGHRRMIGFTGMYALALLAGAYGFRRIYWDETLVAVADGMLKTLAGIQILIVVLGGCNAVHRASLRDYECKMIESHRLTPMTSVTVVLGYLFGTTLQIQAFFFVGLMEGTVLSALANLPIKGWILGNLLILIAGVTLWSAVVLSGLRQAKPLSPAGFLIGAAVLGGASIPLLPAAGLLLSAYPIMLGFIMSTGSSWSASGAMPFIAAVNAVMTVFWVSAAAAKYRRPDLPALNCVRGLILLAFWTVFGAIGSVAYFYFPFGGGGFGPMGKDTMVMQWVATISLSFLVALPAIAGSVECYILIRLGTAARRWSDRVSPFLVCWLATLVVVLPLATIGSALQSDILFQQPVVEHPTVMAILVWFFTIAACFLAFLTAAEAHLLCGCRVKKPRILATTFLIAIWAAPPIFNELRISWIEGQDVFATADPSWIMGCSPVGVVAEVWRNSASIEWGGAATNMLFPGLAFQFVLALSLGFLGRRGLRKLSIPASSRPTGDQQVSDTRLSVDS